MALAAKRYGFLKALRQEVAEVSRLLEIHQDAIDGLCARHKILFLNQGDNDPPPILATLRRT